MSVVSIMTSIPQRMQLHLIYVLMQDVRKNRVNRPQIVYVLSSDIKLLLVVLLQGQLDIACERQVAGSSGSLR